jgi:hypothetical protein
MGHQEYVNLRHAPSRRTGLAIGVAERVLYGEVGSLSQSLTTAALPFEGAPKGRREHHVRKREVFDDLAKVEADNQAFASPAANVRGALKLSVGTDYTDARHCKKR